MTFRRLNAEDVELYKEAFLWLDESPAWYQEMDDAFPWTLEDFMASSNDVDIGIFDGQQLLGFMRIAPLGNQAVNIHLWSNRNCGTSVLLPVCVSIREQLFDLGMKEIVAWVAKKHHRLKHFCDTLGFRPTGFTMIKGQYHTQPIEWQKLVIGRD